MDRLIADIASGERQAQPGDGGIVRQHLSTAPFDRGCRTEGEWARIGDTVVGCPHPSIPGTFIEEHTSISNLDRHLAKRIRDGQWKPSTTPREYESDCQRAAGSAYLVKAGIRGGAPLAAAQSRLAASNFPLVNIRDGEVAFVVYNAFRRRLVTCYYLPEALAPVQVYRRWVQYPVVLRIVP